MSSEAIGAICIVVLLVLMYFRMWVGFAMLFVGFWGIVAILGWDVGLAVIGTVPLRNVATYPLTAMPLFMLMGVVVANTGVGTDLFHSAHRWIGQLRGGLSMATVVACAGLALLALHGIGAENALGIHWPALLAVFGGAALLGVYPRLGPGRTAG